MRSARGVAVLALLDMEAGGYSAAVLDKWFSLNSGLLPEDKTLVAKLFYGVLERKMALDYFIDKNVKKSPEITILNIIRLALYQVYFCDNIPEHSAVDESVKLCKSFKKTSAASYANGVLRAILREKPDFSFAFIKDEKTRFSLRYSCDKTLVGMLYKDHAGEKTEELLAASLEKPPTYFRLNSVLGTEEELLTIVGAGRYKLEKALLPYSARVLEQSGAIKNSKLFKEGFFHVQDLSSQIAAAVVCDGLEAGGSILDLCAAPGGKSFTMAQIMGEQAKILAFDIFDKKIETILADAERLKIKSISAAVQSADEFSKDIHLADRVLCDVPCSGLGVIAKKPEIKYKNYDEIKDLPALQIAIINNAARYVKLGGRLIYSTCTLLKRENENIVNEFISNNPEFEAESLPKFLAPNGENMRTIFPHDFESDGFFIASFRRKKG